MARKERFALDMGNNTKVRNLDELKEHFNLDKTVDFFRDGTLLTWLEDRYYDDEAEAIAAIPPDAEDPHAAICEALDIPFEKDSEKPIFDPEMFHRIAEKKLILAQKTDDIEIIKNADKTALTQEDLADLLDLDFPVIYLCGKKFNVPIRVKHKKYIGILGTPEIEIRARSSIERQEPDISFEYVLLPWGKAEEAHISDDDEAERNIPRNYIYQDDDTGKTMVVIDGETYEDSIIARKFYKKAKERETRMNIEAAVKRGEIDTNTIYLSPENGKTYVIANGKIYDDSTLARNYYEQALKNLKSKSRK